ncbi:hypothetical protein [Ruminococcus sp.]|uniref:hypothetical protein n=1 Tax=Ruminococcus sp. TaxID=41978 RepID=UPI00386FF16F
MIQKTKRPISILLVLLMIVGMFSVLPISAGATDYTEDFVNLEDLVAGDTLSAWSGDYLSLNYRGYSLIIKGGTYRERLNPETQADDTEFQEDQIGDLTIEGEEYAPLLTVWIDGGDKKAYYPLDAEGNPSDKWYVLSNENYTVTLAGHVPAAADPVYALVGTMNNWNTADTTYQLIKNPENTDEYMLLNFEADANTEFKVVKNGAWEAPTNNFTLNDAGTYDIYFRPDGSGNTADGWVDGKVFANNFRAPVTYVAQIGDTKYETLEAAFAAAADGNTITLLADCAGNGIKVPQGKFANNGLTVDFNGHKYTVDGETVGSTGTETLAFQLLKNNNITFQNGTIYSEKAKMLVQNYCNLGLYDMTLTLNNTSYNGAYTLSNNNGNAGIHNTTINANPTPGSFAFDVCRYSSYPSINVEVTGNSVINGDVEISASKGDPKDGFSLTLSGGTMNGDIVVDPSAQTAIENYPAKAVVNKANTFTQTAPEGFEWKNNSDGTSTLVALPYAAKIDDTKYRTLEEAFAAAVDGDTITLLADSTGNGIIVPQGKFATGLTVDFDDFTYTVDGETVGSTGTETNGFQLLKDNKVTFKNGTITSAKAKILVQNYSDLTLLGMTLTLDNPNYTSAYTLSNNNGNVVIDSTTINANPAGGFAFDVCRFSSYPSVHVTVKGDSEINGDVEIYASKSDPKEGFSLTLEKGTMNGNIVVDPTAQSLIGEDNKVTKKDTFDQAAPADFEWVSNDDGTSSLVAIEYVAQIGNTKYRTLEAAFAAAVDGDTITLLADCAGNGIKVTPAGKFATGLTVDFDGHTYTVDGTTVGSTGTETLAFQLLKDNKVTFKNGTIYSEKAKMLVQNYCDLTLDNMTLTLNNTSYDGAYTLSNNNGSAVIKDTTINANPTTGSFAFDVCRYSSYPSVDVTVTGTSKINGDVEISASKGDAKQGFSLTLESGTLNGDIVVDASAQALVGENNKVTKAATFTQEAPEGFKWVDNGDNTASLAPMEYVAEVVSGNNVGKKYETVNDAVAAAGENGEVKLIADITGNVGIGGVLTPYDTTLDLNGHTITNTGGSGITLYSQYSAPATFTIKDSSPEHTGGISITKRYYGDACISDSSGRQVIIEGGIYTSNDKALYISSDEGWTINGGTFTGKIFVKSDVEITDGTFHGEVVQDSSYDYSTSPATEIPAEIAISGGTFDNPVPADFCADGYDPKDNGDGTYTVTPHEHDWDYENVTWTFTENASHSIYAKYTLTCKTDPTHTKEQTGSGTLMSTVAVDGDKFVYSHSAVKIDGISVAVPNYTRNVADGIINQYELKAAVKVAGNYKLANDITGFYDNVKPVDGFVLDGQNHMIKYGTMNAGGRVMFVAADQNTKFTLKNITLDGNNRAKWAVCAYTGNSGNNAGNVITLDTVTIQNFKSNDYVGAINAFGSSTWNLKDCTITGNTTVDDSDGLSGSAVWAGSKATINIDGGTYDEVYLHSYSGTGAVLNADGGATIDNLVLDLTKTDTLKANIDEATVGAITSNEGTIPEEAVVMDPAKATVAAPEGYKWVDSDETGMKTLAQIVYVAQIGETKYETLEEAFAAAVDGDTIKVLADCSGNGIKVLKNRFKTNGLTVDFDGHTYTMDGETVGSTGTETQAFQLQYNNKITFKNGTLYSKKALFLVQNYSNLTLDGMTLTLDNPNYAYGYTLSNNYGNTVIKDTTINANPAGKFAFDVCRGGGSNAYTYVNVTVEGNSVINGDVEVDARNGDPKTGFSLNLNGGTMTGDIKLTANAETAIDNNPDKASVNKKNTFTQEPAEGYEWKDNGDGTSTLVKIVDLFAGYGLSLQGDIGLIFYLDPAAADIDIADVNTVEIDFDCDHYTYHVTDFTKSGDYIKVTCYVPAAYMAHDIDAYNVKINDVALDDTDTYSVQQYAQRIIDDPVGCNIPVAKADEAVALMKEMLNYGAKAQEVFKGQMLAPAVYDDIDEYEMATVTADMIGNAIHGTATDMSTVHPEPDANFYAPSVIYLSKTTLRMVFLIPTGNGSTCPDEYSGNQAPWYYWKDVTDIPAAELDEQQQFEINGVTFNYSVLDYAKAVVTGGSPAQKDLAASLYLYNQAANAFFAD